MIWNLVKKVGKQLSQLNAVEDENGILVTDLKLIEEIVLSELGKIFNGQNSEIFSFKGEQIIKAAYTSIHGAHSEWKTNGRNPNEFESEVCEEVTVAQVKKWVNSLKDSRA